MLKWFKYLLALPQVVGFIRGLLELVRTAEDLLAGGQRGEEKKALVLDLLDAAIALGDKLGIREAADVDRAQLRAAAGAVIDALVSILNAAGIFKHGAAGA